MKRNDTASQATCYTIKLKAYIIPIYACEVNNVRLIKFEKNVTYNETEILYKGSE